MVPIAAAVPVPEECPMPAELYKLHFSPTACTASNVCELGPGVSLVLTIRITEQESSSHNCCGTGLGLGLSWTLQPLPAAQDANIKNSAFLSQ